MERDAKVQDLTPGPCLLIKLGYLLNFGEAVLKEGITRCVNGLEEKMSR